MDTSLHKPLLRVAVEEWGTWVRVRKDPHQPGLHIVGPMANLLHILASKLNFEYELVQPPDHVWGVPLPDGNWTGMLGMLQRREVEFALGPFGVTNSRAQVCDFSVPVKTENSAILVERPRLQSDVAGFLKPFTLEVWLLILASVTAMLVTFWWVMVRESRLLGHTVRGQPLSTSILWVLKALTQEGTEWLPRGNGCRVLVASWLLATLVFMSSYSGILTARLTVPRVTVPIDAMAQLVNQKRMPWRLESGSWMLQYFQEAPDGVRQRVYAGHSGTFPDCWAAREAIAQGHYAALCDHTTMKKAMSWDFSTSGACHLYISREVIHSFNLALAFSRGSAYTRPADYWIRRLKESGVLDLWLEQEIVNTTQCLLPPSADRPSTHITALDLAAYLGPFLVLAAGVSVALVVFMMEKITTRCCSQ